MQVYTLKRTGRRPLRFTAELLAEFETSMDRAHPDYSGETGISQRGAVYRTEGGSYIVEFNTYSAWQGSRDTYSVETFSSLEQVLGYIEREIGGIVADELLEQLSSQDGVAEEIE